MRDGNRQNIDVVSAWLGTHRKKTAGAFLVYALSPFPSSYLFIAYALSGLPLGFVGAAFFVGRLVSYTIWAGLERLASSFVDPEALFEGKYLGVGFVLSQLALLRLVYVLMKLDWKLLLEQRKLKWRRPLRQSDRNDAGQSVPDLMTLSVEQEATRRRQVVPDRAKFLASKPRLCHPGAKNR